MSVSSSATVCAPSRSVASMPALPMAMSALRHCRRVFGIGGASRSALMHLSTSFLLSNWTR
jgi:hypothetical protein